MRIHSLFFLLAGCWLLFQMGCTKETVSLPAELVVTYNSPNIVTPGSQVLFSANMDVTWIAADSAGGTFNEDGLYTAPNRSGSFLITAVAKEDISRRTSVEFFVTNFAEDFLRLRDGGLVVYFRHPLADSGNDGFVGAEWWKSCDQTIARQLGITGQLQAQQTGTVFWRLGLPGVKFMTSEFCRTRETAQLMNQGNATITQDSILTAYVYDEPNRHPSTLALISSQDVAEGELHIMVSHEFGPGYPPLPQVTLGDAMVFQPIVGQDPEFLGRIPAKAWTGLFRSN